jgi:hypothetical protein
MSVHDHVEVVRQPNPLEVGLEPVVIVGEQSDANVTAFGRPG